MHHHASKPPSQRQLKIGEMLRHALSELLMHASHYEPSLAGCSITVSEVRISPDLKNATAYVMPLGGQAPEGFLKALESLVPQLRKSLAKKVQLRYLPRIIFRMDNSFEEAHRIETLLHRTQEEDASHPSKKH